MKRLTNSKPYLLTITLLSLLGALAFWFQSSPWVLKEYKRLCPINTHTPSELQDCLQGYWNQYNFTNPLMYTCLAIALVSLIGWGILQFSQKKD